MGIEVGHGADFEFDVDDAASWSAEDAEKIVTYLFARDGDVEHTTNWDLIQAIKEARGEEEAAGEGANEEKTPQTVEEVKEWVGEDPDRATQAYTAEAERDDPRKSLVEWLESHFDFA